ASPCWRSTTSNSSRFGNAAPADAALAIGPYRVAYASSACRASSGVFPLRLQPGQSSALAKTRFEPISNTTRTAATRQHYCRDRDRHEDAQAQRPGQGDVQRDRPLGALDHAAADV